MATPLFPRRKPPEARQYIDLFCHYDEGLKRHLICSDFYYAKIKCEIIPSRFLGTWMMVDDVPRDMSWAAKYFAGERGNYEDHSGEMYARWDCPFCGGESQIIPSSQIVTRDGEL